MSGPKGDDRLRLDWLGGRYAVCRLDPAEQIPDWAGLGGPAELTSITRTSEELSIITSQDRVPEAVRAERGFVALRVRGPLDFALVGVLARLSGALAGEGIPILAISTHDTDVLLVRIEEAASAARALSRVAQIGGEPPFEGTSGARSSGRCEPAAEAPHPGAPG